MKYSLILQLTLGLVLLFLYSLPISGADLSWDNGASTSNWNTTDANWNGQTWNNATPDNAIFDNRSETINITQPITAGTFTMRNGGRQSGSHNLTFNGGSLSFNSGTMEGRGLGGNVDRLSESNDQKLTLNNSTWSSTGDFTITRSTLQIQGNSNVTIGGLLEGTSAWNNLILQDSSSLTVAGGVDFRTIASNISLEGGTLTTSSIWGNDRPAGASTTNVNFNGGKVVASAANADFLKVSYNGDRAEHTGSANIASGGLRLDTNSHDVGITNAMGGVGGLIKEGAGTLTLTAVNSYSGGNTINGGTLNINGDNALGAGATTISFSGDSTLQAGAAHVVTGGGRNVDIDNGVTATFDSNGNTLTINGTISGAGAAGIRKVGNGTLALGAANNYAGVTEIASGTIHLLNTTNGSPPVLLNGTFESPDVADYTYLLPTDWDHGEAVVADLGTSFTWKVPDNGSQQGLGIQRVQQISQDVTFNSTGFYELSWITNGRNGSQVNPYYVTIDGADVGSINTWDNSDNTWKDASKLFFIDTPGTYAVGFRGTAGADFTSFIDNVVLNPASGTGTLPSTTAVYISGATGRLDLNGVDQTLSSLEGVVGSSVALGNGTLTVNSSAGTHDFAGEISGSGNLVKTGAGTMELSGTNTYTGTTTVDGGTLLVNGAISGAGGDVNINAGATLGGAGVIDRSISINSGGTVAPGNSIDTLTPLDHTQVDNSTYEWEFNATAADLIATPGTLALESTWTLEVIPDGLITETILSDQEFDLFTFETAFTVDGVTPALGINPLTPLNYVLDTSALPTEFLENSDLEIYYELNSGGDGRVFLTGLANVTSTVPEPATISIWLLLASLLLGWGWHHRQSGKTARVA